MAYIGKSPGTGVRNRFIYTATAGQTTFSGSDDHSRTLSYTDAEFTDVFLNGVKLDKSDYTATSGTSIVLGSAASVDDILEVLAFDTFSVFSGDFSQDVTVGADLTVDTDTLHVDSANNRVGIGTTSPDRLLTLQGDNSYMWIKDAGGGNTAFIGSDGTNDGWLRLYDSSHTAKVEIESDGVTYFNGGNVGIGLTNPDDYYSTQLVVKVDDEDGITVVNDADETGYLMFADGASGNAQYRGYVGYDHASSTEALILASAGRMRFFTADPQTEKVTIDAAGHVGIGQSAPAYPVDAKSTSNGDILFRATHQGSGSVAFHGNYVSSSGTAYWGYWIYNGVVVGSITSTGSTTAYNQSSDYRLKENVTDLTGAITRVKTLQPKRFNFIHDTTDTLVDGFLAHQAATAVPEAVTGTHNETRAVTNAVLAADGKLLAEDVLQADWTAGKLATTDDDGNAVDALYPSDSTWAASHDEPVYQGIDQAKLVPLLTAALQEAITKIEALETQNADFETRIAALEAV